MRELLMLLSVILTGSQAASLIGSDHYYQVFAIGLEEKAAKEGGHRDLMYLRSDYNPFSVQEVKTSISVSCCVEARHIEGEVFTATCPPGCDEFSHRLWGSGVYTEDSSFCAAAIHDGIISADRGGAVTVRKIEGKSSYQGATRNGLESKPHDKAKTSFIFQNAGKARRPVYEVSCIVQASWIKETDFNIICPGGCGVVTDRLWGDMMYTDDSYLCAAAIHGGMIKDSIGGEVHVIKAGVQNGFKGKNRNGVISSGYSGGKESFELEKTSEKSSSILEVSCYFRVDHVEEEVFTARCPPGCDTVSDQLYGTGIYTQDSFLCASAIHAGRIPAPLGGVVTVFKTSGNINFVGSLQNSISSKDSEYLNTSFIFQASTIKQPEIVTVACQLRGDHLRDDVSTVVCPGDCDFETYDVWGSETYKSDSHICASAAHAGIIDVSLGGPVTVKRVPGMKAYEGNTKQRIISKPFAESSTAFTFADNIEKVGSILAATCDFTADLISDDLFSLKCPAGCSGGSSKVWGDGVYTSDSPLCAAAIHNGYLKESLGGIITVHKVQAKATYSAANRNGIQSFEYGKWSSASVIFQRPCVEVEPMYPVTCETRANFMVDDAFTVVCPAGCDMNIDNNEVWGTGVYTDDSYICGAAIHDGRLNADVGGQIMVGKIPGMSTYAGSTQNTIESKSKGKWRKSITFEDAVLQHTSTFTITCDVEANMIMDEEYSVICPPGCEEETERVWGNDIYTEDSFICAAAIHAGKINVGEGGRVSVVTTEAKNFESTTRNGIQSKPYDKEAKAWKFV
ncbi:uncharacterized protein LOC120347949 isoform X1 [Styela clava]